MGLAADLEYEIARANGFQRAVAWLFSTKVGSWAGQWLVPVFDRMLDKLSGGRFAASDILAALPPLWLTTTGARSGQPRRHALYGIPIDGDLAVIGSNFGQESNPAWVHNLLACPDAYVSYQERSVGVSARLATTVEQAEVWSAASRIYVGYAKYRKRAAHRDFKVFVLEPA